MRAWGPLVLVWVLCAGPLSAVGAEGQAWQAVEHYDADRRVDDLANWRAYRGAEVAEVEGPEAGRSALRVAVRDPKFGGLSITATPRGGFGNRVRVTLRYRVIAGGPVTVYAGPNTWNQVAGVLTSHQWETVVMEVGLLSDFHLVLHVVQPGPEGVFELAEVSVSAQGVDRAVRQRLGPVAVAIRCDGPADAAAAFRVTGEPPPEVTRVETDDAPGPIYRVTAPAAVEEDTRYISQGLGALPAGTRLNLRCRCRVAAGTQAVLGFLSEGTAASQQQMTPAEWAEVSLEHVLEHDGSPAWFMGPAGGEAAEFRVAEPQVWVTLPDPTGPGALALPEERQPITFDAGDAKSIFIAPPWPGFPKIKCHLEYNSRWSYRFPTSHEVELAPARDDLNLTWHFEGDPVEYSVRMRADVPGSLLVEARLSNAGEEAVEGFSPGFCLQIGGASAPKTFAYTIIARNGTAFPLHLGTPFDPGPELWPGNGWVRAHYVHSAAYRERVEQGEAYQPARTGEIREAGDFPLLARRVPGRDAWIAWVWPNAQGYFGNTQTPCMHMDPLMAACPAGEARSVFGRMAFFEGSWEELYAWAQAERDALEALVAERP
jgi:hypothetical protein